MCEIAPFPPPFVYDDEPMYKTHKQPISFVQNVYLNGNLKDK